MGVIRNATNRALVNLAFLLFVEGHQIGIDINFFIVVWFVLHQLPGHPL